MVTNVGPITLSMDGMAQLRPASVVPKTISFVLVRSPTVKAQAARSIVAVVIRDLPLRSHRIDVVYDDWALGRYLADGREGKSTRIRSSNFERQNCRVFSSSSCRYSMNLLNGIFACEFVKSPR